MPILITDDGSLLTRITYALYLLVVNL